MLGWPNCLPERGEPARCLPDSCEPRADHEHVGRVSNLPDLAADLAWTGWKPAPLLGAAAERARLCTGPAHGHEVVESDRPRLQARSSVPTNDAARCVPGLRAGRFAGFAPPCARGLRASGRLPPAPQPLHRAPPQPRFPPLLAVAPAWSPRRFAGRSRAIAGTELQLDRAQLPHLSWSLHARVPPGRRLRRRPSPATATGSRCS